MKIFDRWKNIELDENDISYSREKNKYERRMKTYGHILTDDYADCSFASWCGVGNNVSFFMHIHKKWNHRKFVRKLQQELSNEKHTRYISKV